ncbi:hypothetical protein CBOM_00370 [Ceraceosorus bombacis]|uniref:Uncharacterized protein n=2 Tax=Ceraceosorus TaxID=401624 RepID=A0A0P1B985_9BASI|nr:hypothetical protein IE81DRAFT_322923 [Ceraceosorus guamensis]PWN43003.1 hypothetical protein IE81DRAFT_322923 [Ceraceosorus guamensis]CEH12382.1 hypothetical protein CBOM_00370 [Ceraceosorus bombacis]
MKFTLVAAFASVAALVAFAPAAQAADDRVIADFKGGNGDEFCNSWRCNCINYVPKNKKLSFQTAYCQKGDFSGNFPDSKARVFCSFTDGSKTTTVTKHVAAATFATLE